MKFTLSLFSIFVMGSATATARALPDLDFFAIVRTYEYAAPKVDAKVASVWDGSNFTEMCANSVFAYNQNPAVFCKSPSAAQMSFVGVGVDGTQLQTEVLASNPLFAKILSSARNELRVRTSWALATCDGVDIKTPSGSESIESTIQQLRTYDFTQYMSCKFKALTTAASEDAAGLVTYPARSLNLTILDNDDVQMSSSDLLGAIPIYFTRKTAAVATAETAAMDAATRFADIVRGYGALLVDMRDAPTPDRKASLLAYLAQNKQILITSLQTLDQQLPSCGTMAKLNVNYTVKRGYAFVHTLEAKILGAYPFGEITGH